MIVNQRIHKKIYVFNNPVINSFYRQLFSEFTVLFVLYIPALLLYFSILVINVAKCAKIRNINIKFQPLKRRHRVNGRAIGLFEYD